MSQQNTSYTNPEDLFNHAVSLHETGEIKEAIALYHELLKHFPSVAMLHLNLGLAYSDYDEGQKARDHLQTALELDPENPSIQFSLAYHLKNSGEIKDASKIYESLLVHDENQPDVLYNLANCYKDMADHDTAITTYRKVLSIDQTHKSARNNLSFLLHKENRIDDAISSYRKLLEIDSDNVSARYLLSALVGENSTEAPPDAYIQEVFDNYSDHYDKSLLDELEYCVPGKLKSAFLSLNITNGFNSVLDLGCGSGLAAETFADFSNCFTGVDLSSNMLGLAADKKLYQELYCASIEDYLDTTENTYDLVLAADVFAYFGSLDAAFTKVKNVSHGQTYFAFSAELNKEEGYQVRKSGRFAHSSQYIEETLQSTGWEIVFKDIAGIRKERGVWIEGILIIAAIQNS